MVRKRLIAHAAIVVAFAAVYSLIDWVDIAPYGFPDLDNYRYGFQSGWYIFQKMNLGLFDLFVSEGVWVYLFDFLYAWVGDIETAFLIISFISILLMGFYVVRHAGNPLYLLFFINPAFLELSIGQIRSAFAAGFFWIAVHVRSLPAKLALVVFAASIHTAFFLFGAFYIIFELLRPTRFAERLMARPVLAATLLVVLGIMVTAARNGVLAALGDVRAYQFLEFTSGIFLALAWMSFLVVYLACREESEMGFDGAFYAFCGSQALFSAMIGVYGTRFSSIALPALAVMCSQLQPRYRLFFVLQYVVFTGVYFIYWFEAQGRAL